MTKTKFAPSLTGYIHIGNLRSALFAYLIAKHDGGDFILRIEDTDQNAYQPGALEYIYDMLNIFHLDYDEGPKKELDNTEFIQSKRINIYKNYAEELLKKGEAYYCFCDKSLLNEKRMEANETKEGYLYEDPCRMIGMEDAKNRVLAGEKYIIRAKMPKTGNTGFHDLVYGDITVENNTLDDFIIIKEDGTPTFNFANVIDDALMQITHITRGNEFLASTPKYLILYDALGFPRPEFIHLPLVMNKNGEPFDKRLNEDNLLDLLNQGFLPEAILNYIALLGWDPKNNQEFFTLEELIREFEIKNISRRPCCYDIQKLKWFNKHYIKEMDQEKYLNFIRPYLERVYNLNDKTEDWIIKLLLMNKEHIDFGSEIALVCTPFFQNSINEENLKCLKGHELSLKTLTTFLKEAEQVSHWNKESINNSFRNTAIKTKQNGENLFLPIRIAVTGNKKGLDLISTLELLGQVTVLKRLQNSINLY